MKKVFVLFYNGSHADHLNVLGIFAAREDAIKAGKQFVNHNQVSQFKLSINEKVLGELSQSALLEL